MEDRFIVRPPSLPPVLLTRDCSGEPADLWRNKMSSSAKGCKQQNIMFNFCCNKREIPNASSKRCWPTMHGEIKRQMKNLLKDNIYHQHRTITMFSSAITPSYYNSVKGYIRDLDQAKRSVC